MSVAASPQPVPPLHVAPPRPPLVQRALAALRPSVLIANIPGPIFQKEVRVSGRKSGTYWMRFLYASALLLLVMAVYFGNTDSSMRYGGSASLQLQMLQSVAPIVTVTILWFQLPGLMLAGAIFGAPSICEEKRAGTLATLLTTPLKAYQIVIGKTSAFFVQVLILTLIAAPLLLAIRVFGGVSAELIVGGMALSLSVALLAGLSALFMSIRAKRTPGALVGAVVLVLLLQGIVPLISLLIAFKSRTPPSPGAFVNASAPGALIMLSMESFGESFGGPGVATKAWVCSTLYTLGWCVVMLLISSLSLRRVMAKEAEGGSVIPKGKKVKKGKGAPAPELETPLATTTTEGAVTEVVPGIKKKRRSNVPTDGTSRTVSDFPVMWRETQQPSFKSRFQMWLILLVLGVVFGVLYYNVEDPSDGTLSIVVGVILMIVTLCSAAAGATASVSGEREARTWEALLTTPMSAAQIVAGKVIGAVRRQWFIPAVLLAHLVIAVVWSITFGHSYSPRSSRDEAVSPIVFIWVLPLLAAPIFALSATGLYFSTVCRKSVAAAAANVGFALACWAMLPILVGIVFRGNNLKYPFGGILVCNPVGMMGVAVNGASEGKYDLFTFGNCESGEFALALMFYLAAHIVVGLTAMALTRRVIRHQTARLR